MPTHPHHAHNHHNSVRARRRQTAQCPHLSWYLTWCRCTSVESMYVATRPVQTSSSQRTIDLADYLSIKKFIGLFLNFPSWFLKPVRPSVRLSHRSTTTAAGLLLSARSRSIDSCCCRATCGPLKLWSYYKKAKRTCYYY